jgi:hypothetical protein
MQDTKNQRLDLVEVSTPSKTEKDSVQRGGASNVEALALTTTERINRTSSGTAQDE